MSKPWVRVVFRTPENYPAAFAHGPRAQLEEIRAVAREAADAWEADPENAGKPKLVEKVPPTFFDAADDLEDRIFGWVTSNRPPEECHFHEKHAKDAKEGAGPHAGN